MRRARSHRPLSSEQIAHNHALSLARRTVEAVFGTLKRCYGFHRMRYFTIDRNRVAFALACMTFNIRRWRSLAAS
jgi:IS5 family transposase